MNVHIWYTKGVNQWRWTLTNPLDDKTMESGNSEELETALKDVGLTIRHLMNKESKE